MISCNRKENTIYLFRKCLLNHYSCRQKEFISNWLMCCKYLELLAPVTLLLLISLKNQMKHLWRFLIDAVSFVLILQSISGNVQSGAMTFNLFFKYAAVKFFYQIIPSPFPKELRIFVCCAFVGGSFNIWIFRNMHERMMYWWYCLLLLYHAKMHYFFFFVHNPYCLVLLHTSSD